MTMKKKHLRPGPNLGKHHFLRFRFFEAGNCFVQCAFCAEKGGSSSDQAGETAFEKNKLGGWKYCYIVGKSQIFTKFTAECCPSHVRNFVGKKHGIHETSPDSKTSWIRFMAVSLRNPRERKYQNLISVPYASGKKHTPKNTIRESATYNA